MWRDKILKYNYGTLSIETAESWSWAGVHSEYLKKECPSKAQFKRRTFRVPN